MHTVYTSDNDLVYQRDAKYFYYQHGPMARTELGEKQVQGTDYAFTIQGWVKGVNSTVLNETKDIGKDGAYGTDYMSSDNNIHKDFGSDASSYSLNYFNNDYNPIKLAAKNFLADMTNLNVAGATGFKLSADAPDLYNGNISSMVTSIYDINPVSVDKGKAKPQITGYQYDQLHRLKHMKAYSSMQIATGGNHSEAIDLTANKWITPDATQNYSGVYEMDLNYDKMGNIKTLTRKGDAQYTTSWQAKQMDNLTYNYSSAPIVIASLGKQHTINNRLTQVVDNSSPSADANYIGLDIDGTHNYDYNNIGSLKSDVTEEIQTIEWTDAHKVKSVIRTSTSSKSDIYFGYDPFGRRISKTVIGKSIPGVQDPSQTKTTHYVLDAEGNNMAIYLEELIIGTPSLKCESRTIFGSDRLGMNKREVIMSSSPTVPPLAYTITFGEKEYETHNHLGNVITTISDRKIMVATDLIVQLDFETCTAPCGYVTVLLPPATVLSIVNVSGNNKLNVNSNAIYDGAHYFFNTTVGHTYSVQYDVSAGSTPNMTVLYALYQQSPYSPAGLSGGYVQYGLNSFQFTATTPVSDLKVMKASNNTVFEDFNIDNLVIQDLTPSSTATNLQVNYKPEILTTTDYYAKGIVIG